MNRFIHRPSPALAVALLALFIALGSTGLARTESQKPGNASAKAAKAGPRGPRGPMGLRGPAGSALAYARVVNGVLDAANSKNVTVTQVLPSLGGTCLRVTTAQAPRNVVAIIDNSGANPITTGVAGTLNPTVLAPNCPAGSSAVITTVESGAFVLKPFYVTFN